MKVKVSEAKGQVLGYLVAKCEGYFDIGMASVHDGVTSVFYFPLWQPSTDWALAGPIIEREWLDVTPWPNESDEDLRWQCKQHDSIDCVAFGPTPLVAAMRCYVTSKLGDEVEVPDELA